MIAWLAVVVLGLTGRRRTAAKIASVSLALALLVLLVVLVVLMQPSHTDWPGGLIPFLPFGDVPVVLASLAACSLALSPGPRRGLAIVGWRRACLMIAGLSAGFGFPAIVQLVNPAAPLGDLAFSLLGILAIALAVAVTRVRGPVGRRVAGLVATGLLPSLAVSIPLREVPAVFLVPIARQPVRRRAGVAGGDRILAGAGGTPRAAGRAGPGFHRSLRRVPGLLQSPAAARFLNPATGAGLGRLAGRAIPTRRDQPMARLRRQPVPATLTTTPCHSAHRAVQETGRRSGADGSIAAGTPCIGTEHLLLSLLAEGDGAAARERRGLPVLGQRPRAGGISFDPDSAIDCDHLEQAKRTKEPGWTEAEPQLLLLPGPVRDAVLSWALPGR